MRTSVTIQTLLIDIFQHLTTIRKKGIEGTQSSSRIIKRSSFSKAHDMALLAHNRNPNFIHETIMNIQSQSTFNNTTDLFAINFIAFIAWARRVAETYNFLGTLLGNRFKFCELYRSIKQLKTGASL